ncbi:Ig-like domain-containing protein [Pseudomonas sp. LB3P25]
MTDEKDESLFPNPQVVITEPTEGQVVRYNYFPVKGRDGSIWVDVYKVLPSGRELLGGSITPAGLWMVPVYLPNGSYAICAGFESNMSKTINITVNSVSTGPRITVPEGDVVGNIQWLTISGKGATPGYSVLVHKDGGYIGNSENVPSDGTWSFGVDITNFPARFGIEVGHLGGPTSDERTFSKLGVPNILIPGDGDVTDVRGPISGDGGVSRAIVEVLKDFEHLTKIGQGTVGTNGEWSITTFDEEMSPGPFSIVARQIFQGLPSAPSAPKTFNVRPPRVVLQQPIVDANGTVTIKGTGHVGADLDIHYVDDPKVLHTFKVTETPWTKPFPNWLPDTYSIRARQWVKGIGDQPIFSEWTLQTVTFTVKVPPPTLTHNVGVDQKPVFSGVGNSWVGQPAAQVEVRLSNTPAPVVPIATVEAGRWSSAAAEPWAPGTHRVVARQLFQATDKPKLESDWTSEISVVIRAPLPSIDTITENDRSPEIAGTCWKGAVVTLFFSDNPTKHLVLNIGNEWSFKRPQPFQPGSYIVTATQTFGGQTSNEATRSFTVKVPKPVIKPIAVPVGQNPEIEGSGGVADAVMTIFEYVTESPLGDAPVSGDNWSVQLNELEFRRYDIYAVQTINGLPSERSERIQFEVMLLPPVVDTPQAQDKVARTFRIEGHASRASGSDVAQVHVWLEGGTEPWARIRVKYDGTWRFDATLPLGTQTLKFKQCFKGKESVFSEDLVIRVVPAKPLIETPANGEAVESRLAISGFGFPGDTVGVAFADALDVELGSTKVLQNCTWSLWLSLERPAGHPEFVAQQRFGDYLSGWTASRAVELRTHPPQFTAPLPCRWVESKPTFAGTAGVGGAVFLYAWFDPEKMLASNSAVGESWEVTPTRDLLPDEHWVRAIHQAGGEGQTSATADSPRFEGLPAKERGADSAS